MMLQQKEWQVHAKMVKYWKAPKPVHFILNLLHSNKSKEQHEKHPENTENSIS